MDAISLKARSILITGARGFSGQHACRYFAQHGWQVTAVVRRGADRFMDHIRYAAAELTRQAEVDALIQEVQPEAVLHLAGCNSAADSWRHPALHIETNLLATVYLLDALRRVGKGRMLVVSSMLNFRLDGSSKPPHPYSLSKTLQLLTAQAWGQLFQQDVMIVKPSNLIGPGESTGICGLLGRYIARRERGDVLKPFRLSTRTEQRDFLDVRDAVAAYAVILEQGAAGQVYPIGSGRLRSLGELAEAFCAAAGCTLEIEAGKQAVQADPELADLQAIRALGWQPSIPLQSSIADVLAYYRRHTDEPNGRRPA